VNPVGNAAKFTENDQVTLRLVTGADGILVWIKVQDTGIGVAYLDP
jgi:signal transduction histidine kinase